MFYYFVVRVSLRLNIFHFVRLRAKLKCTGSEISLNQPSRRKLTKYQKVYYTIYKRFRSNILTNINIINRTSLKRRVWAELCTTDEDQTRT